MPHRANMGTPVLGDICIITLSTVTQQECQSQNSIIQAQYIH